MAGVSYGKSSISVSTETSKASVTVGEPFHYQIVIKHDSDVKLVDSIEGRHLADFRIKEAKEIGPMVEGHQIVEGRSFALVAYQIGHYVIESIIVRYIDQDSKPGEMVTDKLYITVRSIDPLRTPESDIRGLKAVREIEFFSQPVRVILGGIGVFFLLLCLVWWQIRRRKVPATPIRVPHEQALLDLEALVNLNFIRDGKIVEYHAALSSIIRTYLERRFAFPALESTTKEIRWALKDRSWASEIRDDVVSILEICDGAKFARFLPSGETISLLHKKAEDVIKKTQPIPEDSRPTADAVLARNKPHDTI